LARGVGDACNEADTAQRGDDGKSEAIHEAELNLEAGASELDRGDAPLICNEHNDFAAKRCRSLDCDRDAGGGRCPSAPQPRSPAIERAKRVEGSAPPMRC